MMYLVSLHVFSLWLCERRRAALAVYTLLLAYILTMWFSPSSAFDCHRPHGLAGCQRTSYTALLAPLVVPTYLRLALFLWCRLGLRAEWKHVKDRCLFCDAGGTRTRAVRDLIEGSNASLQSSGGSCLPEVSIMCGDLSPAPWRYCSSMRSMERWL